MYELKKDGTGCNNMVPKKNYYELMGYKMESEAPVVVPSQKKAETAVNDQQHSANANIGNNSYINITSTDDYVEIIKAKLKPVIYDKWELGQVFYTIVCGLQKIIDTFNKNQPTYKRISALDIRKEPFEKSSTKKIKRNLV